MSAISTCITAPTDSEICFACLIGASFASAKATRLKLRGILIHKWIHQPLKAALQSTMSNARRPREDALQHGPRKKLYVLPSSHHSTHAKPLSRTLTDPLVHHGRHFGRITHAFCNVGALITNGLERIAESSENVLEDLPSK